MTISLIFSQFGLPLSILPKSLFIQSLWLHFCQWNYEWRNVEFRKKIPKMLKLSVQVKCSSGCWNTSEMLKKYLRKKNLRKKKYLSKKENNIWANFVLSASTCLSERTKTELALKFSKTKDKSFFFCFWHSWDWKRIDAHKGCKVGPLPHKKK